MVSESAATLIWEDRRPVAVARSDGDVPWVSVSELGSVIGWELRPEGLYRLGLCVPVPPGREDELLGPGGDGVNVAALAGLCGQPVIHDNEHRVWVVGRSAAAGSEALASGVAADFTLPDLDGVRHSLSDYLGNKVFLVTWASW